VSKITTHILDISQGRPAADVEVILYHDTREIARGRTNTDGRLTDWSEITDRNAAVGPGIYTIRFETKPYFANQALTTFYPFVDIHFEITDATHYHIPLLLSPWGYSTYRGS
jgi:5-hydroxyisourate hydrolase